MSMKKIDSGALQGYVGSDPTKLGKNLGRMRATFDAAQQSFFRRAGCLGISPDRMNELRDQAWDRAVRAQQYCESPIERMMLGPLLLANYDGFGTIPAKIFLPKIENTPPAGDVLIIPQFAYVRYRLDLAVIGFDDQRGVKIVALECDGDDFHQDPLKEQIKDAMFGALNVTVVHATGREINRDAVAVAARVSSVLVDWKASQDAVGG